MKKVLFAIQVFTILASLPAYILLELNHKTSYVPKKTELINTNVNSSVYKSVEDFTWGKQYVCF